MPQTVSPLTTCGPSAGSPPPDWKSRKARAIAWVSKTTPWVAEVAFQTMVSPGLTATFAAEPPPLGTQVGVPLRMVPSISIAGVAREPLIARPCWLQKKPRVVPAGMSDLTVARARRVPSRCAASGGVPQTVSPLTTCGPSAGSPPPDSKSRKARARASVSKTTPWVAVVAFQMMVSPGLTRRFAAPPPQLTSQVGVPLTIVPSISIVGVGAGGGCLIGEPGAGWTLSASSFRGIELNTKAGSVAML